MLDHVGGGLLQSRFGSDQLRQLSPAAFGFLASGDVFFVLDDFVDFLVQFIDLNITPRISFEIFSICCTGFIWCFVCVC